MKRATVMLLLVFILMGGAFAAQNSNKGRARSKAAAVDCTTVDDTALATSVKDKLATSKSLKEAGINADAKAGVVTLTGTVKSAGLKGTATRMARSVKCVKKVDNQITVEKGAAATPRKSTRNANR